MKREDLIQKWLNHELNAQEFEAFKKLEDYDALTTLSNNLKQFKADDYNTDKELNHVLDAIKDSKKQISWIKPLMRVAAILAICFSLYYYTTTLDTTIATMAMQKTYIELPDDSKVSLNAQSQLTYNKKNWNDDRDVTLDGEAFFKVAKGSTFNVNTDAGMITVYGTEFNVKQRKNYFEVICYEGLVGVTYNSQETKLKPGNSFLIINGELIATEKETQSSPSWLNNESYFKSLPFSEVIAEFERQYNVTINTDNIKSDQLFTGGFAHNNIDVALQAITLPLHLTYSKSNHTITLKRE